MKKVLIICPIYWPYPGGGSQSFPLVAKALSNTYQVSVITEYHPRLPLASSSNNTKIYRILPRRDTLGKKTLAKSAFSYVQTYFQLYLVLLVSIVLGYQVFHITRYTSPALWPILTIIKMLRRRLVYDSRSSVYLDREYKQLKASLHYYDLILCNSLSSQAAVKACIPAQSQTRIRYIVNPLLLRSSNLVQQTSTQIVPSQPYLVAIGTICERKASKFLVYQYSLLYPKLDRLAKSASNTSSQIPSLIIAGRNDLGAHFIDFLRDYPFVYYLGEVSHEESISLLVNSLGSINLSLSEGIPRTSLESLFYKTPAILPACVPEFVKLCPKTCFNLQLHHALNPYYACPSFQSLLKVLINNPSQIIKYNSAYDIKSHSFKMFSSKLLNEYSSL